MATVLSTLYPPLIDTFMPAFPNTQMAEANFSISPYNSSYDIHYLHVTLVDQRTNKNAFATDANVDTPAGTALINGVWIIPFNEILNGNINSFLDLNREANRYTLYIPPSLLKQNEVNERTFVVNSYYKLQIRFDKNNDPNLSLSAINSDYLSTKRAYFSEWSSVCLLKAIPEITVHFNNFTPELDDYLKQTNTSITNLPSDFVVPVREPQYIPGLIPFAGNLTFAGFDDAGLNKSTSTEYYQRDIKTTSNSEYLMSYRIVVTNQKNVVLRDSGVQYPSRTEKTNNFYWLCDMTLTSKSSDEEESKEEKDTSITLSDDYTVTLTFTTNNQYTFSKSFKFTLVDSIVDNFHPNFYFLNKRMLPYYGQGYISETDNEVAKENKKVLVTSEDGMIELKITSTEPHLSPGYLFIKRASALDNFQNWQVLDCYFTPNGVFERTIVDNTLSSLTEYKYACQFLTIKGNWSKNIVYDSTIYPDFHDILISRGNRQLAIRYNAQVTSMTPVVSRVKIDTLGGRYPKFAENAKIHYKQFQLNGLIIAESDYNRKFLSELDFSKEMSTYDKHMNGKYMIRNDTVIESKQAYLDSADVTNHDVYPTDNWWWERKFREEAIEWLNDGEPKLYRSMTEGNLIVMIDGISLTPNPQLGRRIWNFSATLYEVGDGNSLEQLDALGIYDIANVHDENLTKLIEGESGDLPYEEHRHLGQSFSITAKDVSQSTTKIVNIEKTNDRHAIVPIESNYLKKTEDGSIIVSNKKDKTWAETMTVGEKIQFWYEGMHRDFDPASIRLRDVKIQFESLPQWYDLNALTPEGTNPYAIGLTMSIWNSTLGEWEEKTGRAYYTKNTKGEWVLTWEPIEGWNEPLWNKAGKSITDFINDWEEACGNLYKKIYLSKDTKETVYIGTAAAETDYYKLNSKIDDKEFLLRTDVWNSLRKKEGEEWHLLPSIEDDTSLNELYYTTKKKEDELNINSYVFLEKDLLEGDGNIVYKNKKNEEDIIYKDNVQPAQDSNYYRLLNNNSKEYYIGENEEEVQAFYPINKNYEYLRIDNNDDVQKFIVDNSLYRKIGTDCVIKNSFNSINDDNSISVGKKDLQQLDNLFSYKITFTSGQNNKNGTNIFNNYYNSKITTNKEKLQLNADTSSKLKSLLEWYFEESTENQEDSTNESTENSTDNGFNKEVIITFFTTETENSTENDWWILTTDDKIYKNIKWQEKFEYDQTQESFILIESKYEKQNINIISKDLQKIFKYWVDKDGKKINNNINNYINNNKDKNKIEIEIEPVFEDKISIEQKLYLSSTNNDNNEYELSFSLKRGESIKIYNLPNKDIVSWKVFSKNKTLKDDDNPNIYMDTNSCENAFSGNYIIGQDNSGPAIETIYVLQKKNEKIDLMRVARNEKDIIFSNIPSFDSEAEYVVKRLNDNVERDTKKIKNENNFIYFIFVNSFNLVKTENDKLKIDISEDYILNTDLLEKDNNTYFWGEKKIQTQKSNGEWEWITKQMFLPYTSEQEGKAEKYIKYKSIYLSISNIQQYPYFYFDDNNYLKIQNYEKIYYKTDNKDPDIILEQPNIHYFQIFTRDDILEADRTQTNPKPHYVKVSDWENSEKWIEKCHYNYSLDPHIKEIYNGKSYQYQEQQKTLYSEWEWWDKSNIIQSKIYKNKNDKDSSVPMFEETTNDVDVYYKTTIKWEGYPTDNYYPLDKFFELKDDDNNNNISSLKKYVFVGNRNKYLPKDFIVTGNDVIASGPGNELIRVNLDTGQDWNITSSNDDKPGIIDAVKEFLEEAADGQQKIVSKNYGLGYKLRLILTSPYDPTITLRRTIFVNDRGYYQVPSNLIVKDIGLFDGAQATIDYILEYELKYSDDSEPNSYEVAENVVGQVSGEWDFSTSIAPMIQSKYWAYDKDESGYTTTQQSVDYWRATSYDGVPYTRLLMKSTGLTESAEYVVSRSGVLNLETDYPTEGLIIAGKRMVEAPKDRQKFLDEWEYVLDESVFAHDGSEDEGMIHWWVVYPYEGEMPGLDWEDWMESDVLVKISLSENFEMRNIANWWYQISDVFPPEGQPEVQIINPQYNTIYAIVTPGGIEYKIYYLNQGWYPVEFLKNDDNETDYSFCNAKVPVSGTINYRASILKKLWINE